MGWVFIQSLEPRMLLSGTGGDHGPTPSGDRAQVIADLKQYKNHSETFRTLLAADKLALAKDCRSLDGAIKPLRMKLEADTKAFRSALAADKAAGQPVRDADMPAILADLKKMADDHEHGDALAADKAQLEADVKKFRDDMAPYEAKTKADYLSFSALLKSDKDAIDAAGKAHSSDCAAHKSKLHDDEVLMKQTLAADVEKIKADVKKLHDNGGGEPTKPHTEPTTTHNESASTHH